MRLFIILAIAAISCNSGTTDVKAFIPGVYIRHFEGLYSKGEDTLIISKIDGVNSYFILHRTTFRRLRNNQLSAPERTTENWSAVYNPRDKILYEQKRERMLSFMPDSNKMFVGGSAYYKIK
ncbi:hypothetical protein FC093_21945 [Ilyomonas limi]|uniref:Uncharacterized protein n=1 Tax=Ilyomonas limi TaxID=2575867 RepID=A0A4V5UTE7_9BACT|nr:hypothetical protein [Ilyomonas limi]TKK64713.1 hypothetical protein FC093_21945 [Ilyomonas limi]